MLTKDVGGKKTRGFFAVFVCAIFILLSFAIVGVVAQANSTPYYSQTLAEVRCDVCHAPFQTPEGGGTPFCLCPPIEPIPDGRGLAGELVEILRTYVFPGLILLSVVWAVWLGIEFGRASDANKRKMAKDRFFKGIAIVIIFVVLFGILSVIPA